MFNTICKEMFKEENYVEALSFCASYFDNCETMDEAYDIFNELDEKIWEVASDCEGTEQALRISTALQVGLDGLENILSWED